MKKRHAYAEPQPLPRDPNDNPWYADQKQIMPTPKLPGWLSLILLAPFRLAYGLLATFAALHQATGGSGGEEESDDVYPSYDLDAWARERGYINYAHFEEDQALPPRVVD